MSDIQTDNAAAPARKKGRLLSFVIRLCGLGLAVLVLVMPMISAAGGFGVQASQTGFQAMPWLAALVPLIGVGLLILEVGRFSDALAFLVAAGSCGYLVYSLQQVGQYNQQMTRMGQNEVSSLFSVSMELQAGAFVLFGLTALCLIQALRRN